MLVFPLSDETLLCVCGGGGHISFSTNINALIKHFLEVSDCEQHTRGSATRPPSPLSSDDAVRPMKARATLG